MAPRLPFSRTSAIPGPDRGCPKAPLPRQNGYFVLSSRETRETIFPGSSPGQVVKFIISLVRPPPRLRSNIRRYPRNNTYEKGFLYFFKTHLQSAPDGTPKIAWICVRSLLAYCCIAEYTNTALSRVGVRTVRCINIFVCVSPARLGARPCIGGTITGTAPWAAGSLCEHIATHFAAGPCWQ